MEFKGEITGRIIRVIALVALLLGLADAAVLLGVTGSSETPLATLGAAGFSYLAVFSLSLLFAAVGLWIGASWGAVLLVGSAGVEMLLYLMGNPDIRLDAVGFGVRLVLIVAIALIFAFSLRLRRAHD